MAKHLTTISDRVIDAELKNISTAAVAVLLVLKRYCNKDNECWPSIDRMAETLPCCRRTVINALNELEQAGAIQKRKSRNKNGSIYNTYIVRA